MTAAEYNLARKVSDLQFEQLQDSTTQIQIDLARLDGWLQRHISWLIVIGLVAGVGQCVLSFAVLLIVLVK